MSGKLLAGMAAGTFLRRYWQRKPLFARSMLARYVPLLDRGTLFALAARADVESRLVNHRRGRWTVKDGPFLERELARLPATGWTLLVQGIDLVLPQAQELLREFACISYARFDDIMVSYAPPGGGVGPHFDSYDVFLLQLSGRRRWQIGKQRDLSVMEQLPLKILKHFRPQREWITHPGDLLYLPPFWAHDGVAIDDCLTCSIGFRAPGAQELGMRFLEYLQDRLTLDGAYRDPAIKPQRHPAQIGTAMLRQLRRMIGRVRWNDPEIAQFAGQYLSEPKPHVVFDVPRTPMAPKAFRIKIKRHGLRLALQTRMLYRGRHVFINGEPCAVSGTADRQLRRLADERSLPPHTEVSNETADRLYEWYRAGYIKIAVGSFGDIS